MILNLESNGRLCKQGFAYRVVGCNIWRKPHPWVCRGRGTGGDWGRWCGQPESEWRSLWLCRAWGSKPFSHLETQSTHTTVSATTVISSGFLQIIQYYTLYTLSKPPCANILNNTRPAWNHTQPTKKIACTLTSSKPMRRQFFGHFCPPNAGSSNYYSYLHQVWESWMGCPYYRVLLYVRVSLVTW